MRLDKTSNPAFNDYFWENDKSTSEKMSVKGIILKSLISLLIVAAIVVYVWNLYVTGTEIKWFVTGGMITAIVISIIISVRNEWAKFLVPLYAIAKGFFLGGITSYAHAKFLNLPFQAIGVTIMTFFVMLLLYQTRIIVVTKKLRSVIITACASIFIIYLMSWILSFFGIETFIWGTSWLAILFNVLAAIFASLALLLDFDYIEKHKNKAPKEKEWLATWGLLVTLIWLYVEILRLMKKLAIRF